MTHRQPDDWQMPPEDRAEQDIPVADEPDADADPDPEPVRRGEANEADVAEQAVEVPDDEYRDEL